MRRDDWLLQQLPVGMAEDNFLSRFLMIFQTIADTELHQIDTIGHMFNPDVAPDAMVRALGAWIGIDWIDSSLPDALQRRIVNEYTELVQWRGTQRGLRQLLELISLEPAVVHDSGGVYLEDDAPPQPPHVKLYVASVGWATEKDLIRIVRSELPASVTFELYVRDRQIWPPQPDSGGAAEAHVLQEVH
ncbi:MAG TPA: phage tail protein [Ilumatobacteraceae bacterium]